MAFDFDTLTEKLAAQLEELPKDRRAEGLRIVRAKIHNVAGTSKNVLLMRDREQAQVES